MRLLVVKCCASSGCGRVWVKRSANDGVTVHSIHRSCKICLCMIYLLDPLNRATVGAAVVVMLVVSDIAVV